MITFERADHCNFNIGLRSLFWVVLFQVTACSSPEDGFSADVTVSAEREDPDRQDPERKQIVAAFAELCTQVVKAIDLGIHKDRATRILVGRAMMGARWYGETTKRAKNFYEEAFTFHDLAAKIEAEVPSWGLSMLLGDYREPFIIFEGRLAPKPVLVISSQRRYYRGTIETIRYVYNNELRTINYDSLRELTDLPLKSPQDLRNDVTDVVNEINKPTCQKSESEVR